MNDLFPVKINASGLPATTIALSGENCELLERYSYDAF